MDNYLEIISPVIVGIFSWPFLGFIIFLMLKKHIRNLLGNIKQIEAGPIKLKLDKLLADSQAEARSAVKKIKGLGKETKNTEITFFVRKVADIADISPLAAIPFAYSQLEWEIIRELPGVYSNEYEKKFSDSFLQDTFTRDNISENTRDLFEKVKEINNEVLLNKGTSNIITRQDAIEYAKIIEILICVVAAERGDP